MKKLNDEIVNFFYNQGCVIVSTIDENGYPSNACKGIVEIDNNGHVYLLDLYQAKTRSNLERDPHISITAIDEHKFVGYSLKGKARIVTQGEIRAHLAKAWEERITSRLTSRLLRNIRGEKGHARHPEALLPEPQYLISIDVDEIVDLTPHRLKEE
ncbi:MAG TPA: hypothetical protein DCL35_07600 [Candidatus Omnitrophica bacterium]|nr:hypothetical protein [Candidatus Omnitrophota bacterium]